jgi:hypothetical protein
MNYAAWERLPPGGPNGPRGNLRAPGHPDAPVDDSFPGEQTVGLRRPSRQRFRRGKSLISFPVLVTSPQKSREHTTPCLTWSKRISAWGGLIILLALLSWLFSIAPQALPDGRFAGYQFAAMGSLGTAVDARIQTRQRAQKLIIGNRYDIPWGHGQMEVRFKGRKHAVTDLPQRGNEIADMWPILSKGVIVGSGRSHRAQVLWPGLIRKHRQSGDERAETL